MQFAAAVKGFLEYCAVEKQLSQHTLDAYAGDLADFEKWLPSGTAVADISTATMKQYLEQLVVDRKLTSATVRRRFACLRAFFRQLSDVGQAPNPLAEWRPVLPRRRRLPRTLSRPEVRCLLANHAVEERQGKEHPDFQTALRLMVISVMCVNVQVAMPATVHSSSTADNASPHRRTSTRTSSWRVDSTTIFEWS